MKLISPKTYLKIDDTQFYIFNKIWFEHPQSSLLIPLNDMETEIMNQIQRTKIR